MKEKAARENWLPKFEKHQLESKKTIVLNLMHRECLDLKQAADWAGLEIEFTPVNVLPTAGAGSITMEVSQFPYRPTVRPAALSETDSYFRTKRRSLKTRS